MKYVRYLKDNSIYCDLHKKTNFLLSIKVKCGNTHTIDCFYGPFEDYTLFKVKFDVKQVFGQVVYAAQRMVSARYLKIVFDGVSEKDIFICVEPEMKEEPDVSKFKCENDFINKIYEISAETLKACICKHFRGNSYYDKLSESEKNFVDNWRGDITDYVIVDAPRRDREVWVGDLLPEIRTVYTMFKDTDVIKNSLNCILDQMRENGFIPACSIANQTFYEYNCWFVIVLYEYLMLSGDFEYFVAVKEKVKKAVLHIQSVLENNLLRLDVFNTWAYSLKRHNFITSSQCVLYYCFYLSALLFENDDVQLARQFKELAEIIKTQINERGFDSKTGWYYDELDIQEERYSLDANALAVLFGVCPKDKVEGVLKNIKKWLWTKYGTRIQYPREEPTAINHTHSDNIWPFGVTFEIEARFMCGDFEGALELVNRTWGTMIDNGATTFWEAISIDDGTFYTKRFQPKEDDSDTYNSACHGWSAGLPHIFNKYIIGVKPLEFGYRKMEFSPKHVEKFGNLKVNIPTKYGEISVKYEKVQDGLISVELVIPDGIECVYNGEYVLYDEEMKEVKSKLNGKKYLLKTV